MVKILILGAGYGTRLQRDLVNSPDHKHLLGVAKALLPLNNKPLVDYWIDLVRSSAIPSIKVPDDIYIICNEHNYNQFTTWGTQKLFPLTNIWNDGSTSNDTRLGAIVDMAVAVEKFGINEDLLVIAGDTLFLKDFDIKAFLHTAMSNVGSLVSTYKVSEEEMNKTGIIVLKDEFDKGGGKELVRQRIVGLLEKPDPSQTTSRNACPCFYYLKQESLLYLEKYVELKSTMGREEVDATGRFLGWLVERHPVYAYPISGRLDLGNLRDYMEAEQYLSRSIAPCT